MELRTIQKMHKEGYSFFPVTISKDMSTGKYTKKPVVEWKKFQSEKPTLKEVDLWMNGNFNALGLVTGSVNGITVIDIDSASAKEWAEDNLPSTPLKVSTISGGEHWYYNYNENAKTIIKFQHADIDVRSDGGFVVAPPSDGYTVIDGMMSKHLKSLPSLPNELFVNKELTPIEKAIQTDVEVMSDREKVRNISLEDAMNVAAKFGLEFDSSKHCVQDKSLSVTSNSGSAYFNDFGGTGSGGDLVWLIKDYLPERHPELAEKYGAAGRSLKEVISKVAKSLSIELTSSVNEMEPVFYFSPTVESYISLKADGEAIFLKRSTISQMYLSTMKKPFDNWENVPLADVVYEPKMPSQYTKGNITYLNQFHDRGLLDTKSDNEGTHPLFDLLLENLIEDEAIRKHFMNWLAYFFQNLEKGVTAFVFYGVAGSGKGLLLDVIGHIFGKRNCIAIGNNELEGNYNSWAENKLFVNLNEVSMKSKNSASANKLKALITDKTVQVNDKYIKLRQVVNLANYIITSNEKLPVLVDEHDRRFNVIYTAKALIAQDWFDDSTYKVIIDEAEEIAKTLSAFNTSKSTYIKVVKSDVKLDLQSRSKSDDELFIDSLFKSDYTVFFESCDIDINQYLVTEGSKVFITNEGLRKLYGEYTGTTISGSDFQKLTRSGLPQAINKKIDGKAVKIRYLAS